LVRTGKFKLDKLKQQQAQQQLQQKAKQNL
jgi:hypothetical protein